MFRGFRARIVLTGSILVCGVCTPRVETRTRSHVEPPLNAQQITHEQNVISPAPDKPTVVVRREVKDPATSRGAHLASGSVEAAMSFDERGKQAYRQLGCIGCHGATGTGSDRGPDLTSGSWVHCDGSVNGIATVLRRGIPRDQFVAPHFKQAMKPATTKLKDDTTMMALAAYVRSLSQ